MPTELKEIVFYQLHIFYKSQNGLFSIDPKMLDRKYCGLLGKDFMRFVKDLVDKEEIK